jgi:hypothetical protein
VILMSADRYRLNSRDFYRQGLNLAIACNTCPLTIQVAERLLENCYKIVQFLYYVQVILLVRCLIRIDKKCSSKDIAEVFDASLSVLPS